MKERWKRPSSSQRFVQLASAMIAYAGDEHALRGIAKLIAIDELTFGPLVERALGHAMNWRNPFVVAYQGLSIGDDRLSRYIASWAETSADSARMQRLWAESLGTKYGRQLTHEDWIRDPLASRLRNPELLLEQMIRLTKDRAEQRAQQ